MWFGWFLWPPDSSSPHFKNLYSRIAVHTTCKLCVFVQRNFKKWRFQRQSEMGPDYLLVAPFLHTSFSPFLGTRKIQSALKKYSIIIYWSVSRSTDPIPLFRYLNNTARAWHRGRCLNRWDRKPLQDNLAESYPFFFPTHNKERSPQFCAYLVY